MMIATRPPFRRLLWLHERLRGNSGPSLRQVQEEFEISERTARRDIEFLRDQLNAPVEYDRQKNAYRYSDQTFSLPSMVLTEGELFALCIAEKALEQYRGSPIHSNLHSAFEKLCAALPERVTVDAQALSKALTFESGPIRAVDPDTFIAVTHALRQNQQLSLRYDSMSQGKVTDRTVDPYHLLNHRGDWYLIAYCHTRRSVRDFLVARILKCERLRTKFTVPADFDLKQYQEQSFGIIKGGKPVRVRIAFDATEAPYILERQWHSTQATFPQPDGSVHLEMTVAGLSEVASWVLCYGERAIVLAPKSLRDMVTATAKGILDTYSRR